MILMKFEMNSRLSFYLFFAFVLSGMSGLMYQTVWVRMLIRYLGSTTAATATVLCVFMAGLALGAIFGGKLSDRIRHRLSAYVALEVGIAFTSLLASFFAISSLGDVYVSFYDLLNNNPLYLNTARIAFSMLCLVIPTALMGATLPLLVTFITRQHIQFQYGLGRLYSVNTFGAVAGVFITGFVLIGSLGESASLYLAALFNLIAALIVYKINRQIKTREEKARETIDPKTESVVPPAYPMRIRCWSRIAIFVSGFTALAYEILWTRLLMIPLRTSIYAFSFMLGVFLLGIAFGSWLSTHFSVSRDRPAFTFAVIEIIIGFLTIAGMLTFSFFGEVSTGFTTSFHLGVITALMMVFPVAVAFGWQFPVAVRCCISDSTLPGKETGWAYSANTIGAIVGSISTGFILIPLLGTAMTMILLAVLNIVLGGILLHYTPREECGKRPLVAAGVLVSGFLIVALHVGDPYEKVMRERIARYLGPDAQLYAFYEGVAGTTVASGFSRNPFARHLFVNGESMTALVSETKLMAHLPLTLSKDPHRLLVICFGMGTTVRSASRYPGTKLRIDAVDIIPRVFDCFGYFHSDAEQIISHPNIHLYSDDGRNFLLARKTLYDVITIDPAPPLYSAGTVNLYTREFLELCKSRITEHGVVCLWLPPAPVSELLMIFRTFLNVFPGASLWGGFTAPGFFVIGGHQSYEQTRSSISGLAHQLSKIDDLSEWEDFYRDESLLKQLYLLGPDQLNILVKNVTEVTDDHPYTEFPLWRGVITKKVPILTSDLIRWHLKRKRHEKNP